MGMRVGIAEILEKISKMKRKDDRVKALRENDSFALKTVLQGALHPDIKWLLPEGVPPYKPTELVDQENVFFHDSRKLIHFIEGGNPSLNQVKREAMFIEMLETVAPADAELLCVIKDKKLPWKTITPEIVLQAFPGLFPNEQI
jgi:hypothetical protein